MRKVRLAEVSWRRGTLTTRLDSGHRAAPDRVPVYPPVVLDVFSRRIVGWSMIHPLHTELALGVLNMALGKGRPEGVVHQGLAVQPRSLSDNGAERMGVLPSTGSAGDCFDNAMAGSFFATLECERIDRRSFRTQADTFMTIFERVETETRAQAQFGPRHGALTSGY